MKVENTLQNRLEKVPQIIQIAMDPPGDIAGQYFLVPHVHGPSLRPVYKKDCDEHAGPYYLMFSANHWCVQGTMDTAHEDEQLIICPDLAFHPGAVTALWQAVSQNSVSCTGEPEITF